MSRFAIKSGLPSICTGCVVPTSGLRPGISVSGRYVISCAERRDELVS